MHKSCMGEEYPMYGTIGNVINTVTPQWSNREQLRLSAPAKFWL